MNNKNITTINKDLKQIADQKNDLNFLKDAQKQIYKTRLQAIKIVNNQAAKARMGGAYS